MALIDCSKCGGKISSTAVRCPHCSHSTTAAGSCPECGDPISETQEFCRGCGFPLRPPAKAPAPAPPPPRPARETTRTRDRKLKLPGRRNPGDGPDKPRS